MASLDSVAYESIGSPDSDDSFVVYNSDCIPEWKTIGELVGDVQDDDPQTNDNPKFLFVNDSGDLSKCEGMVVPVAGCSFGSVLYNDELSGVSWMPIDFIIDELDRRMHPLLTLNFVESFYNLYSDRIQMIITTHETRLVTTDLFRLDEINFVERDEDYNTVVFRAKDVIKDQNKRLDEMYLEDKLWGVPHIS